jgi:hypothetical protein
MGITRKTALRRAPRALATTLALALLIAVLLAGAAAAAGHEGMGKGAAKPGTPRAKAPKGTTATTTPAFTWTKARGAASYELRVYQGRKQLLEKTGLGKNRRSWKSSMALPTNVDLTWKVRARNAAGAGAWSRSLKFKVVPPSPEKAITAFSFSSPAAAGVINETLHTVAVAVPFGTDVTALVATFTTTGASVAIAGTPQISGVTVNNFSNPVTYTVTAADGSTQAYVVTVTAAASPAKAITAFSFATPAAIGVINETLHTIAVTVPFGTNVTALVATFTTTGASVAIAGTPQTSGVTANNFSNPVTYTVTAADASTQAYVVTVTVAAPVLAIGDPYQGGVIAYLDGTGQHGLIAAPVNQSSGIRWYNGTNVVTGATALGLGTGSANTTAIIAAQGGTPATYAAGLARAYTGGGYTDWYLPSKDELNRLYALKVLGFGSLGSSSYWSSSEISATSAWTQIFGDGYQYGALKSTTIRVRAVRTF